MSKSDYLCPHKGERSRQNGPGPTHDDVRQRWLSKLGES